MGTLRTIAITATVAFDDDLAPTRGQNAAPSPACAGAVKNKPTESSHQPEFHASGTLFVDVVGRCDQPISPGMPHSPSAHHFPLATRHSGHSYDPAQDDTGD